MSMYIYIMLSSVPFLYVSECHESTFDSAKVQKNIDIQL